MHLYLPSLTGVLIDTVAFGPFEVEGSKPKRTALTVKGSKMHFFFKERKKKITSKVSRFLLNKDLFSSLSIENYALLYYLKSCLLPENNCTSLF